MSAHHHHHGHPGSDAVEYLDLEAQVLRSYRSTVVAWLRQAATGRPRRRILDLGAGTGVGSLELAQRFGGAEVTAVDVSGPQLARLRGRALDLGLAPRIHTVEADLDAEWPAVGPVDLTWASMSLHHFADPDRVLRDLHAATRPGGLLAVAEDAGGLRFLPPDAGVGRPGLEERCLAELRLELTRTLPHLGSDWPPRLRAAGFTIVAEREFRIEVHAAEQADVVRFAQLWFERLATVVADRLAPDDRAALAALVDRTGPAALRGRYDLCVRGTRTVTLARRD
jgi:SAM-dependent methyltransferase